MYRKCTGHLLTDIDTFISYHIYTVVLTDILTHLFLITFIVVHEIL